MSVEALPAVSNTSPSDWKYVSEGGATLVLSYAGPRDIRFDGMVLRLRKAIAATSVVPPSKLESERDDRAVVFHRQIIHRLIPNDYLPRLVDVQVDPDWLSKLAHLIQPYRPLLRRERDEIDTTKHKAVLATDLTASESWAVEIKPKWGFLPNPNHLSPENRSIKMHTCRYCMHSYLKSVRGEVSAVGFCPLDLFSGVKERVERAVGALWDAWFDSAGRINNLKIFVSGRPLAANEASSVDFLRRVLAPNSSYTALGDFRDIFICKVVPILQTSPLLSSLSKLQRTLDPLDIEGITSLWSSCQNSLDCDESEVLPEEPEPTIQEYSSFLDAYLASYDEMDHAHPDGKNLRYYTLSYLLSATFKDCSIILRPNLLGGLSRPIAVQLQDVQTVDGGVVTVIDLDDKPLRKLRQWAQLDREIVETYRGLEQKKSCVDESVY